MKRSVSVASCLLVGAALSVAQQPVQHYSGYWPSNWYTNASVVTADATNNTFIGGNYRPGTSLIKSIFIAKMAPTSLQQWFVPFTFDVDAYVNDILVDSATGNIYVSATRGTFAVGSTSYGMLIKLNSAGVHQWTREVALGRDGGFGKLDKTLTGNIVVGGSLQTTTGMLHKHALIRQYDPNGNVMWTQEYYNPSLSVDYTGGFVKVLNDGTIIVIGKAMDDDLLWLRLSAGGAVLDNLEYEPPAAQGFSGVPSVDLATGDTYVAGSTYQGIGNPTDAHVIRIDINGVVVNSYTRPPTSAGFEGSIADATFSNGKLYLVGSEQYFDDDYRTFVMGLNPNLSEAWSATIENATDDPSSAAIACRGQVLDALGNRVSFMGVESGPSGTRLLTSTFSSAGALLGSRRETKAGPYLADLKLLGTGAFVVAGAWSPAGHWQPTYWKFYDGVKTLTTPMTCIGGNNFTLKVYLSDPSFNANVRLTSNSPSLSLPSLVNFPVGSTMVNVTGSTSAVAANTPVTIAAWVTEPGGNSTVKTVPVTVVPPPTLDTLSISPTTAYSFGTINGTVSLAFRNGPSPTVITLSDNTSLLTTPPTATIPGGGSFANFRIDVGSVPTNTVKTISATLGAVTRTQSVTLRPGIFSITMPPSVTGGSVTAADVMLTGSAAGSGQTVTLQASGPELNNPASVVIPAGSNQLRVKFTTDPVGANVNRTLSAIVGGVIRSATISVETGPALSTLVAPTTMAGGTSVNGTLTLTASGAPSRYVAVAATAPLLVPDLVLVSATGNATFSIQALPVSTSTVRNVSASMGGVTRTRTITITP